MLLILIWISFFIFYSSYLFSVLFLGLLVFVFMLVYMSGVMFVKYLVVLVYISGVVVFILYISCMCWGSSSSFMKGYLILGIFVFFLFDLGSYSKFSDVGEFMWMYLFFSFLFGSMIGIYSLSLFKVAGSSRL